jgi:glycosyltransferase involved in cell wall biosynthesis
MHSNFVELTKEKNVLFITTKNIDYIRNTQEIRIIRENSKCVQIIFSNREKYIGRVIEVWKKIINYKMKNVDVIFVGFAPQLILPFFYIKMRKKIIIIDFFISVYDTLIHDRKKFKDKGIIAKICYWFDYIVLKKTNYVITDTKADAEYFIREFKINAEKFEILYLEADFSIYYPRKQHKRADLQDKFVVLYFGSILPLQGVNVVLDAVRLLRDSSNIYFQIIGPILDKFNKPIQKNVEYIDWLEQKELAEYIANADLCLAGHFNGEIEKAKRTIPGKAYIYNAMEKPMILGENEANKELFSQEKENIYYIQMGNAKALADKISLLFDAWN